MKKPSSRSLALAALFGGTAVASLHAQTFTYNNGGATGVWSNPANWTAAAAYPNAVGAIALMNTGAGFSVDLDVDATISALRNSAGSARIFAVTNAGGKTLTLDGTGFTNGFGNANTSEIRATSSGGIVSAAHLKLSNTNLDIGTTSSNNAAAQITLTGTITATTNQTITVRNNRRQTNLNGDIGTSGAGEITIVNLSSSGTGIADPNQLNIAGNLGAKVVQLTQGVGVTTGMVITGANAAFSGDVTQLANSITVNGSGTLGDFNTIAISAGTMSLGNNFALGDHATLELGGSGLLNLNFSGTDTISALSLDGGTSFVASGIWGAIGSGAANQSAFFTGAGLLNIAAAAIPEPSTYALGLGLGALVFGLGRRARARSQA